jgi:hypothetical protein
MRLRISAALLLAIAGAISLSCGGVVDPSQNTMQSFTGLVPVGGSDKHQFSVANTGELDVKVGNLSPAATAVIGVQWVGAGDGSCNGQLLQNNQFGTPNSTVISTQAPSGSYCIIMYDPGIYTQPETYAVTVSHP